MNSEMNHSETVFLRQLAPDDDTHLVRWFTPFAEEFLCGHGLLAAAIALHLADGASAYNFVTSKGTLLSAALVDSNGSAGLSSAPNPFTSTPITFNLAFPLSPPLPSLTPPYRHIDLYAEALSLPASDILSLSRDALNDVIIELREDVDFSAAGLEVDAKKLVEASPEGTRSQVLTSRGVGWTGKPGEFEFAKRVFAYGAEGGWPRSPCRVAHLLTFLKRYRSSYRLDLLLARSFLGREAWAKDLERRPAFASRWKGDHHR